LQDASAALCRLTAALGAPVVGAFHVTCADETEAECLGAFQDSFANALLPELKFARRAPFHLATLGARYEPGALAIAEQHFATTDAAHAFKVLFVKLNAHVAVEGAGSRMAFGQMRRYDMPSTACGALHALLEDGGALPFLADLRSAFRSRGVDRIAALCAADMIDPAQRSLFAAVASAELQAQAVLADIARHRSHSPTYYVVVPCVTLNRTGPDTEVLCGVHVVDQRVGPGAAQSYGLGDDPTAYRLSWEGQRVHLRCAQ
jgi:hypothetical protein